MKLFSRDLDPTPYPPPIAHKHLYLWSNHHVKCMMVEVQLSVVLQFV